MSLTLYFHPLSSYCQKALIGLYELEVPFAKQIVDLRDEAERAAFQKLWPLAKFPVLHDKMRDEVVPESSSILEYVELHYAQGRRLIPREPERALTCRLRDAFYDLYVNTPMSKIVTDKLRPADQHDTLGVQSAITQLETAYGIAEDWLQGQPWAVNDSFTLADCAAAPALFYADRVLPIGGHAQLAAYFARLRERPSFARVIEEARPYWSLFPG